MKLILKLFNTFLYTINIINIKNREKSKKGVSNNILHRAKVWTWEMMGFIIINSFLLDSPIQNKLTNYQSLLLFTKMDGPLADLQPVYSSDEQCELSSQSFQNQMNPSPFKGHSLKQYMFNFKYNLMHSNFVHIPYLHRPKIVLEDDSEPVYLLGHLYDHSTNKKFLQHFQSIIWMSYRTSSHSGKSDVGWGCMIRVIQMVFAEILKRHNTQTTSNDLIELFKQGKNHVFSLQNICEEGQIKQRWTGSIEIILAISSIIHKINNRSIKLIDPVLQKMSFNFKISLFSQHITIENFENFQPANNYFPQVVVISNKSPEEGSQNFPKLYIAHAKHLMRMPQFCGMIGGISNQALYIIGFQDDKALILDPHYVQQQNESQKVKYFKNNPRGIPFVELCTSFSFCFYFKDANSYKNWAAELCYSYKVYYPYLTIGMEVEDPQSIIEKYRKRSEDFQTL